MSRYSTMMAGTRMANISLCCCCCCVYQYIVLIWRSSTHYGVRYVELGVALCTHKRMRAICEEKRSPTKTYSYIYRDSLCKDVDASGWMCGLQCSIYD